MIKVIITKDKDLYQKVEVTGHAMYADYGKDIVCSSVSSIVTTTVNGILSFDKDSLSYKVSENGLIISNIKADNITQTLIKNMISLLKEMSENYPDNVEVK